MTMAQVRMRFQISGGRGNTIDEAGNIAFTDWPGPGDILECGDQEAAELIAGGMADPVEDEAPDDGGFLPDPAATPEPAERTEAPEGDRAPDAQRPAQARTTPRTRAAKT